MPSAAASKAVVASFAAESLSLGPHWEYDADTIAKQLGSVTELKAPVKDYHKGKNAGDFTHYGDLSFILLEHIAANKSFNAQAFIEEVATKYADDSFISYRDHSVKDLVSSKQAGKINPSTSEDFGVASTFFPLVALFDNEADLLSATTAYLNVRSSSNNILVLGEFLARLYARVAYNKEKPVDALKALIPTLPENIKALADKAIAAQAEPISTAAKSFGNIFTTPTGLAIPMALGCGYSGAFPIVVHLLLNYTDLEQALVQNANIGGDTSGRALAVALILAAAGQDVPERWTSKVNKIEAINKHLASL